MVAKKIDKERTRSVGRSITAFMVSVDGYVKPEILGQVMIIAESQHSRVVS
jgi:hypothetical protein